MSLAAQGYHARSDVGRTREHNEDTFLCDRALGLYLVADGMGGHAAGEVAAALAAQTVAESVQRGASVVRAFAEGVAGVRAEDVKRLLAEAVRAANTAVFDASRADAQRRGMGTTLTALLLAGDRAFVAHVGDSRAYLLRGGEVRQLTEDHSVLNELRRRGRLRDDALAQVRTEERHHPRGGGV
jgi:serine/threonine protein phosphatase PrpC